MEKNRINQVLEQNAALIDAALQKILDLHDTDFEDLYDAMRYSALAGGKRIRPFIALEFCRMFGGDERAVIPFACAVEMIHAYSLIHDDLPCMDDDDMRRGKPSNHKVFGEAAALLAGDALLTFAFEVAAGNEYASPETIAFAVLSMSRAARSMVGGQIMDMAAENAPDISIGFLHKLQLKKTVAMIVLPAQLGCLCAGKGMGHSELDFAMDYASNIGLAFQIKDDVLDVTGDEKELGKKTGSDGKKGKATYVSLLGLEAAQKEAERLTGKALDALTEIGKLNPAYDTSVLAELAEYLLARKK